ncbi:MAG: acriflavin resistance protein, partial [Bacteroidetes bacterium SW_11_45_7]
MSLTIILFGILGYNYLGVREYPNVNPPIITVSTSYTGADGGVIETQITEPLEESINGISGIRTLESVSRDGRSTITVEFNLERSLEAAANDVRSKVSQAQEQLPDDADPPVIEKSDASASPIVFLNIKSEQRSLLELTDMADNIFKERFQTIQDVSQVQIWGDKTYAMRLWMDPVKMQAYNITPMDVRNALQQENVELPSGRIEGKSIEMPLRTKGRLSTVEEFNNLIIKETDNNIVHFRDIGKARLGPVDKRTILKRDGVPMVGVVIRPQAGANYIKIVDEFYNRLHNIKKDLPADLELGIGFDTTEYIRESIGQVQLTIFIAFLLVITVIFFFLRDWRTTIIPVIVVPIAIIGSFFIMYLLGFSINVLTLLAIVLAIGLVVDDAIVMLENIYKKIEEGKTPKQAAFDGANEIFFA